MPTTDRYIDVGNIRHLHGIDVGNLPRRWYSAATLHGDSCDSGTWTDHTSHRVQELVYMLRNLQGDARLSHEEIRRVLNLRHWRDSYNAARNIGRRRDGDSGRDAAGELTWRRWNRNNRNMRYNPAAPARPGSRPDGSLVCRPFGIELEFGRGTYTGTADGLRHAIVASTVAAGMAAQIEGYNHYTRSYWKMTEDGTVTGGEFVSPVMAGDTASLDEVRDVIRIIRDHGGDSTSGVGMHVHHNMLDFDTPELRLRLIDTLQDAQFALSRYVLPARMQGLTRCGAALMTDDEFNCVRQRVAAIIPGTQPNIPNYNDCGTVTPAGARLDRYRFFNLLTPMKKYGTVEFRGLGATLHAGKMRVWVRMGQAVVEAARLGVTITRDCTPAELVDTLVAANLLGRQTGIKFIAECVRRHPV